MEKIFKDKFTRAAIYIIIAMIFSIIGVLLCDLCVSRFGHEIKFNAIFLTGGGLLFALLLIRLVALTEQ